MKKNANSSMRENFLKMRGGKLISIESIVLGFVILFVMNAIKGYSMGISAVVALIIGFVFPIVVGMFKPLAWIVAIIFSLIWALLIGGIVGAFSAWIGVVVGIVVFIISFRIHKNYSGIMFQGIKSKNKTDITYESTDSVSETVTFCPKCGRRIKSIDGLCDYCDR